MGAFDREKERERMLGRRMSRLFYKIANGRKWEFGDTRYERLRS